jgi:hypothetical protein
VGNRSVQHNGSKELVYQQVLRRFAHFNSVTLSNPAPLFDLLLLALDEEERTGRWHESDGPKDQIAQVILLFSFEVFSLYSQFMCYLAIGYGITLCMAVTGLLHLKTLANQSLVSDGEMIHVIYSCQRCP